MNKIRIPIWVIHYISKDLLEDPSKSEWHLVTAGGNRLIVTRKQGEGFDSLEFMYDDFD